QKLLKIIGSDLVPETAAATVKHHYDLVRNGDSEFLGKIFVTHVLWPCDLHFQIMIAAAKGTNLIVAALNRAFALFRGVGSGNAAIFFGKPEVFLPPVIVFDAPARSLFDNGSKILMQQFQEPVTTDPSRNALVEPVNNMTQMRLHIVEGEIGDNQTH